MSNDLILRDMRAIGWLQSHNDLAYASWTPITNAEKVLFVKAMQGQDFDAAEVIGQTFAVEHVLMHQIDVTHQETGEMVQAIRTVLIGPDKSRIASVSDGVVRSLEAISAAFGKPPWSPPMVVTLKEERSKSGRRYYVLDPKE